MVINNEETAKLQELIEKQREEKEQAERKFLEKEASYQLESGRLDEKEMELATVENYMIESERNLLQTIEKEKAENDMLYAKMLQKNFDCSDRLERKAKRLQVLENQLLEKQKKLKDFYE